VVETDKLVDEFMNNRSKKEGEENEQN